LHIAPRLARSTPFFYGWAILFAAGSSQFVRNAVASLTLAVFMYPMSQDLGWSRLLIAGAAAAGGLASSAASPLVGWLVDRWGVRIVLTVAILILGLSTLSLSWATAPLAFYLAYGVGRVIFSSPIQIGSTVVVSRWFVRRRGRAIGILFAFAAAGMAVFPLLASIIIQSRGWQDAWMFLGFLVWIIALAPVSLLIIQRPEEVGLTPDGTPASDALGQATLAAEPTWTFAEAVKSPSLWLLAAAGGVVFFIQSGTNVHQGAYYQDQGLSATIAASALSLNALFAGVGGLFWGWVCERVPVRYAFAFVAALMAVISGLFITVDTAGEAFLFSALFGFSLGGILVVPTVAFADYFGRRSLGAIRGTTEAIVALSQAAGAIFGAVVFEATGSYRIAFFVYAALGVVAVLLILQARPPGAAPGLHGAAGRGLAPSRHPMLLDPAP